MASKFLLVAQREYLTRVRKRAFVVLTLLVPLLIAGFGATVAYLAISDNTVETVDVLDDSGQRLATRLVSTPTLQFHLVPGGTLAAAKRGFQQAKHEGLLYLPAGFDVEQPTNIQFFGKGNISLKRQLTVESALNKVLSEVKMQQSGLSQEQLERLRSRVDLQAISLDETGKEASSNAMATSGIAYALAILIYFFIFVYGVQIMRGVGEEKSSRVMEVMLSSVKPFDLMMGKIVGIAAVGLTQFLLWGVLSAGATAVLTPLIAKSMKEDTKTEVAARPAAPGAAPVAAETPRNAREQFDQQLSAQQRNNPVTGRFAAFEALRNLPVGTILFGFIVYFLGGYLLYGALFGAVGAAVDDQTDTQQFMFPITLPLVLSYALGVSVILRNPSGSVAFWMSMIPFTSPIAMVIRLPFGVPAWQLALSIALLILGFVGTVWVAARIYRVGILMYGKKITYGELAKWMFYKG